jgi:hypothetical protein
MNKHMNEPNRFKHVVRGKSWESQLLPLEKITDSLR